MSETISAEIKAEFSRIATQLKRQAIVMDVVDAQPSTDSKASWIGQVLYAKAGETWPEWEGQPMTPLAQINLTELPFKPKGLEGYAWVSLFLYEEDTPYDAANGQGWVMRAYKNLDELVPLKQPETKFSIIPHPLSPRVVEDYPSYDELPDAVQDEWSYEISEAFAELYPNQDGFKLGGWAKLIQGELGWEHPSISDDDIEFLFQVDTDEKSRWMWGDVGVGYYGVQKTTQDQQPEWVMTWAC